MVAISALQKAKNEREAVGVELYGFQQTLAKLQMSLEAAQGNFQNINTIRRKVTSLATLYIANDCRTLGRMMALNSSSYQHIYRLQGWS